ncbi:hypothetical protein [Flammeovirga kamogawensis]|uniref:Uncharacterized protein n=1 Tax=Flammeovirga kamogawensis TaxID=373891 RepID=A0ABX8H0A2_9BACT|nr:hypothetical protein [Flammeovirga kamogawensis]MBB6459542.1 hypothetical protein [Flammeovirga kamogawensis]QWG09093.1 hypothetical protein KM029_09145 [Flammeovirga kamogawensis]TRX67381.1 hypothetical protein EO216_04185 [Flammeovirga kamogawensis]
MIELSKKDKDLSLSIADVLINAQGMQSEEEVEDLPKDQLLQLIKSEGSTDAVSDVYLRTFRGILKFDVAYLLRSNRCCS